jgi:hypothetical protein
MAQNFVHNAIGSSWAHTSCWNDLVFEAIIVTGHLEIY